MTDFEKSNRETRGALLGNIFGGLIGGAVAVVCLLSWMWFENWRSDHA